jgi:hypothetical protein
VKPFLADLEALLTAVNNNVRAIRDFTGCLTLTSDGKVSPECLTWIGACMEINFKATKVVKRHRQCGLDQIGTRAATVTNVAVPGYVSKALAAASAIADAAWTATRTYNADLEEIERQQGELQRAVEELRRVYRTDEGVRPERGKPPEAARPVISGPQRYILEILAASRSAMTYDRIVKESTSANRENPRSMPRLSETAVRSNVNVLLALELVARPTGTKKQGVGITDKGRSCL